jgi:hypothetical protein
VSPQILAGIGLPLLLAAIYHGIRRCQSRKDREMQLALAGMHEFEQDPANPLSAACTARSCGLWLEHHVHTGDRPNCSCGECTRWNGAGKFSARNEAA